MHAKEIHLPVLSGSSPSSLSKSASAGKEIVSLPLAARPARLSRIQRQHTALLLEQGTSPCLTLKIEHIRSFSSFLQSGEAGRGNRRVAHGNAELYALEEVGMLRLSSKNPCANDARTNWLCWPGRRWEKCAGAGILLLACFCCGWPRMVCGPPMMIRQRRSMKYMLLSQKAALSAGRMVGHLIGSHPIRYNTRHAPLEEILYVNTP